MFSKQRTVLISCLALLGCASSSEVEWTPRLRYVGSSTVAHFLRDAEAAYGRLAFEYDTLPESVGGELAILEGSADLAGVAGRPRSTTLATGIVATEFGRDAIAAVVHPDNLVRGLTSEELRELFAGRITNWSELGGADIPVRAWIVGAESATRNVFRAAVLGEEDYAGCDVARPDVSILDRVAADPGAIGQISVAFLAEDPRVRALEVDGHAPSATDPDYPLTRPLYLLWWPGRERVAAFVAWALGPEGSAVRGRRFGPVEGR